jgi:hypothetical protein
MSELSLRGFQWRSRVLDSQRREIGADSRLPVGCEWSFVFGRLTQISISCPAWNATIEHSRSRLATDHFLQTFRVPRPLHLNL